MALARYVDRVGDAVVLSLLAPDKTARHQQTGALCARWLGAPERALPALIVLMTSSDPDVAPLAARSAQHIAEALLPGELRERDVSVAFLRTVIADLAAVAEGERPRVDVRYHAGAAADVLAQFVPEPPVAETDEEAEQTPATEQSQL